MGWIDNPMEGWLLGALIADDLERDMINWKDLPPDARAKIRERIDDPSELPPEEEDVRIPKGRLYNKLMRDKDFQAALRSNIEEDVVKVPLHVAPERSTTRRWRWFLLSQVVKGLGLALAELGKLLVQGGDSIARWADRP